MYITYRNANEQDANLLVGIYNAAFYDDFIRYGQCPAYGRTRARMAESVRKFPKQIIECDGWPVGALSVENRGEGRYFVGCLCVIPKYQGRGIGTAAFRHMLAKHADWRRVELVTPTGNVQNIKFYTEKCGMTQGAHEMDGDVDVVRLFIERS